MTEDDGMTSRRIMYRHYALGVINELQQLGYPGEEAKTVFLRHYRGTKRAFGLEPNVHDFAKIIDEFERALKRKYNPGDPDSIYVGNLRDRFIKSKSERSENTMGLTDSEKVDIIIALLESHLKKMQPENTLSNYLESLTGFLKSKDQIIEKVRFRIHPYFLIIFFMKIRIA
ncbi:hypothetical protein LJK87_01375 [Paenibacillus sp. P25]|nr:hypothetical protein LJK87_01375 [Paenibacillus sp. P25]